MTALLLASCNKDKDKTTRDYILDNNCWKIVKVETKGVGSQTYIDATNSFFDACSLDNCYDFKADGSYTVTEGATKCVSTDPETVETGTWTLSADEKILTYTSSDNEVNSGTIETISASSIVLTSQTDLFGTRVDIRITFN